MPEATDPVLVKLQKEFPLSQRPFLALGESLGLPEEEVIRRIAAAKSVGLLRQISAIFDSRRLGYQSALVAARVPEPMLESAAGVVSSHPGVSHNYQRSNDFNLWFTLAVAQDLDFGAELTRLATRAGLERWLALPSLRTFKIEVSLDASTSSSERDEGPRRPEHSQDPVWLSDRDKEAVRLLQEDLPLMTRPFLPTAIKLGMTEAELFDWMAEAGRIGILRRFAGMLRHRKAGFLANGMGIWKLPAGAVQEAGELFATYKAVSHCYERPSSELWPYNLYTMVHAKTEMEAKNVLAEMSRVSGLNDYDVLFSTREFKKERVKYFLEENQGHTLWQPLAQA